MPIKATRTLILSQPAVASALVIAFVLLCSAALFSALATRGITAASARVARTQQTLLASSQLLATITEAETGQRGYLLTRDIKYLAPYDSARTRLSGDFALLRRQFADGTPTQQATLDHLQELVDKKFRELAQTLDLLRVKGLVPALDSVESDEGWHLMNQIRRQLQSIQAREFSDLAWQSNTATKRAEDIQQLNLGLATLAVLLTGLGAWLLVNRVHQLEQLITVCAWTRRVLWQGKWITFEKYFTERFNLHFTHGISEEAAQKMREEADESPPIELPKHRTDHPFPSA